VSEIHFSGFYFRGEPKENRFYTFYEKENQVGNIVHYHPSGPKDTKYKTLSIPDGFELVGVAS
jgi:hypothetical protein